MLVQIWFIFQINWRPKEAKKDEYLIDAMQESIWKEWSVGLVPRPQIIPL